MLRCVASFFSFSTHAPLYGVRRWSSPKAVWRVPLQLTHPRGVRPKVPTGLVWQGTLQLTHTGATMYSNYSDDVSFSSRFFFSAHCSICFCLIAFVSADMEIRFPEATSADSG